MIRICCLAATILLSARLPAAGIEASGSDSLQVVLYEEGVENAYPRFSQDGARILYQSNRTGKWQLYVINRDGSGNQRITNDEFNNYMADWSPDNKRIAFVSDRSGNEDIYVMNADGNGVTNLSKHPARDIHPYWTPDGTSMFFNTNRDDPEGLSIYQMTADGGNPQRVSVTRDVETCARLSPDGSKIVYLQAVGGINDDIVVLDVAGKKLVNLTESNAAEGWPCWTPDGKRVIFSSTHPGTFALYAVARDGGPAVQLTHPKAPWYDARAHVNPKGGEVVFNRQRPGTIAIVIAKLPNG